MSCHGTPMAAHRPAPQRRPKAAAPDAGLHMRQRGRVWRGPGLELNAVLLDFGCVLFLFGGG
eukprot:6043437-Pyramimonas_sp.AAC.1